MRTLGAERERGCGRGRREIILLNVYSYVGRRYSVMEYKRVLKDACLTRVDHHRPTCLHEATTACTQRSILFWSHSPVSSEWGESLRLKQSAAELFKDSPPLTDTSLSYTRILWPIAEHASCIESYVASQCCHEPPRGKTSFANTPSSSALEKGLRAVTRGIRVAENLKADIV